MENAVVQGTDVQVGYKVKAISVAVCVGTISAPTTWGKLTFVPKGNLMPGVGALYILRDFQLPNL